jgi:PAS domain S-box-containing protein
VRGIWERARDLFGGDPAAAEQDLVKASVRSVLDGLISVSGDAILVFDLGGRVLDCSDSVWRGLGLASKERLLGSSVEAWVPPEERSKILSTLARLAAGERVVERFRGRGENTWAEGVATSVLIRDATGLPLFVVCVVRDLKADEQYRDLVESQAEGIGIVDEREVFAMANPAADAIFGLPRGGLVGRSLHELTEPRAFEAVLAQTTQRRRGETSSYELEILRPDGERRWIQVTATPRTRQDGRYLGTYGVFRDVTERRQSEAERRRLETRALQAQKLESLGVLTGGIAHDFNNLLVPIMANASVLLEELPQGSPSREPLEEILTASKQGAVLTRQMLAYTGEDSIAPRRLSLSRVVSELGSLLALSISKRCVLQLEPAEGLPEIEADEHQLQQVVMNLVLNASEAAEPRGGTVRVRTGTRDCDRSELARCHLGEELPGGRYLVLEIRDNGTGMDRSTRERIFEPFFTTRFTGRGMGLSAVEGIVRRLRGAIAVESELGVGTTLTVLLPPACEPPVSELVQPPLPARIPGNRRGVLVIDDDLRVLGAARRLLEHGGYQVLTAQNGPDGIAIHRARRSEIDVVLLDLTLPQMAGPEILAALRVADPEVRVLLTSGFDESEAAERCEGFVGFVPKPYELEPLLEAVQRAIEGPASGGAGRSPGAPSR